MARLVSSLRKNSQVQNAPENIIEAAELLLPHLLDSY
jgi:hypothetical protein